MGDLVFPSIIIALFVVATAYVNACDRLLGDVRDDVGNIEPVEDDRSDVDPSDVANPGIGVLTNDGSVDSGMAG